jgi:multidrug efflux pump subunit AcrA (membrane-fusion protein)
MSDLQVVAGFAEADASKLAVNQPAEVTLSALPDTTVSGSVVAISPTSTTVSNVVTYDATIALTSPPTTVKSGMTASVSVTVASANNVLEVPSSAVTTTGRASTVTVIKNGKQSVVAVTLGLQGDTEDQIDSGLSAGQEVVEPTATVSSASSGSASSTRTGGLTGGLGGGGFGGGGFGG